jgi:hypothetical protein
VRAPRGHRPPPMSRSCNPGTTRESPRRACGGVHIQPRTKITSRTPPATGSVATAAAAAPLCRQRHATCSVRASEPRSIPESACFTTCPEATLTCAAREVTFYLALPSPLHHRRSTLAFFRCAYSCFIPGRRRAAGKIESAPAMADPSGSHSTSNASPNLDLVVGGPLANVAPPSVRSSRRVFVDPNAIRRSRLTLVHA